MSTHYIRLYACFYIYNHKQMGNLQSWFLKKMYTFWQRWQIHRVRSGQNILGQILEHIHQMLDESKSSRGTQREEKQLIFLWIKGKVQRWNDISYQEVCHIFFFSRRVSGPGKIKNRCLCCDEVCERENMAEKAAWASVCKKLRNSC